MDLNNNYFRINQQDEDDEEGFDIETQSTFAAQMREKDIFDKIAYRER